MKKNRFRREISLMLVLCMIFSLALGCTGCGGVGDSTGGGMGASAASMFLRKTEGTVAVADAEGVDVAPEENLSLYSGYTVGTGEGSYAWIDLDKVKLAKLNQNSAAGITKDGKNLSIGVTSGSLFFNVTEPLANGETMEISTSSLMVGIRGTCGWVAQKSVSLLEGTVTVIAGDESVTITAGERARLTDDGTLEVQELTYQSIPAFVARELLDDEALHQAVFEASGLRIPTTYEELVDMLEDVVYSEVIDFEADGSPELLVIQYRAPAEKYGERFRSIIYRMGTDGLKCIFNEGPAVGEYDTRYSCALAERDGRRYVCCQTYSETTAWTQESNLYFGSVAAQDGGSEDWGMTDWVTIVNRESVESESVRVANHDERGFTAFDENRHLISEDYNGVNFSEYTVVRELYTMTP